MQSDTVVGVDLAKSSFQIHIANRNGRMLKTFSHSRKKFSIFLATEKKCTIFMEACGSANYWARKAIQYGHDVKLVAPQYVKPFVKRHKTDAADAEAIVDACTRENMNFVPIKSVAQQDIQSLHRIRSRYVENRTALANQIRGLAGEYGQVCRQGHASLRAMLNEIVTADLSKKSEFDISPVMQNEFLALQEEFSKLDQAILSYDEKLWSVAEGDDRCRRLMTIPGIGPVTATALVSSIGNASEFKNARQLAAWVGLTPRQKSTGGKVTMMGLSKSGNKYLRTLLIHGGRAVMMNAGKKKDPRSEWAVALKERTGMNKAAVAFAHKNIRTVYAILRRGTIYNPSYKGKKKTATCPPETGGQVA
jgi:transposase